TAVSILQIRNLELTRGPRTILKDVNLTVDRTELVAVMGPSGSGKTTILRAVAGLERFQGGRVVVDGVALVGGPPIPAAALRELRRKVGMVFQFHCLFEHLSALANVCLAPVHAHGIPRDAAERRGLDLLKPFGVAHRAGPLPRPLPGGEAPRVAVARPLAGGPPRPLLHEAPPAPGQAA